MKSKGRPTIPVGPDEFLYFRWFRDHVEGNNLPRPDQISVPDQSANRSGLGGRCWYVLIPEMGSSVEAATKRLCMGVLQIRDHDLEYQVVVKDSAFHFKASHDPVDCNYFHCELRVFRNGARLSRDDAEQLRREEKSDFKEGKKWFRTEMAKRLSNTTERLFPIPAIISTAGGNKPI